MANLGTNIALSKETSKHLAELSKLTKQSAQELAEKLLREAIELEMDDFLLSVVADQYDIESSETVGYEDVKWRCLS